MSNASAKNEARAAIAMLAALGDKIVSYRGSAGVITTNGYIEKAADFFGNDVPVADARFIASLLVEDVGEPHKGDRVTDEDGTEWTLLEEIPGDDPWVTDWTVERR